jgi:hypothetical protein
VNQFQKDGVFMKIYNIGTYITHARVYNLKTGFCAVVEILKIKKSFSSFSMYSLNII